MSQEALFDAEGNLLPREDTARKQLLPESRPQAATTFASSQHNIAHSTLEGKNQAGKASTTGSQTVNAAGSSKEQSKKGMLQLACFCFRPRTRSADDPYPQGSLRDRFAAKSTAAGSAAKADAPVTAASNKASDAFSNAVSSKAANADSNRAAAISSKAGLGASGEMGLKGTGGLPAEGGAAGGLARGETASSDWDLKAEQQQTEAAVAASMQDCEAGSTEVQSSIEALLQGAISLAPKHGITAACSSSDDDATEEADHATSSKEGMLCVGSVVYTCSMYTAQYAFKDVHSMSWGTTVVACGKGVQH